MKSQFVKELKAGDKLNDQFQIVKCETKTDKNGNNYLDMELRDNSGNISGKAWKYQGQYDHLLNGDNPILFFKGSVESFNNNKQVSIEAIAKPTEEPSLKDFLPHTQKDIEQMAAELHGIIREIKNPSLNKILTAIFIDDKDYFGKFKICTGAKKLHHAFVGGLLEHTLSAVGFGKVIAGYYPAINKELLISGLMCHDIGKVFEFNHTTFEYTDEGNLMGHLVMSFRHVDEKIYELRRSGAELDEEVVKQLLHIILAHHGKLEFGSPKLPATLEAVVCNFVEDFDAKIEAFLKLENDNPQLHDAANAWLDKSTLIFDNRKLYMRKINK